MQDKPEVEPDAAVMFAGAATRILPPFYLVDKFVYNLTLLSHKSPALNFALFI